MNDNNGRVGARSDGASHASKFVVRPPVLATAPHANFGGDPSPCQATVLPRRRILVVDDTNASSYVLGKLLEKMGHEVRIANDAATAIKHTRNEPPDFVFSDISMPEMDGYQLARCLRQDPRLNNTLLVALTGYGQDSDKRRALEAGFDRHFIKPVSLEDLHSLLASRTPAFPNSGVSRP